MMWFPSRFFRCFFAAMLVACAADEGQADDPAAVVARVGETAIERGQIAAMLRQLGGSPGPDETQRQRADAAVLEQLIDEQILRNELVRAGIGIEPEAVSVAIDRLRKQVAAQGKDFEAVLAASGRSLEALREQAALELAVEAYVRPRMTDLAIERVFQKSHRELDGTRLRISHIVLRPDGVGDAAAVEALRTRAVAIRSEIVQGRLSFADAARQYSAGPSRRAGGDIGWISREGPMTDAFAAEVYGIPKGSITQPFLTTFGVHLATVTTVEPGRVGLATVRGRVEKILAAELVRGLVAEGRKQTTIWIAPGVPHLDPATFGQPVAMRPVRVGEEDESDLSP